MIAKQIALKARKEMEDACEVEEEVLILENAIQSAILAEREACAKIAEDGQNCRTCGDFFIGDRGHECEYPNWDMPTVDQVALAIRARSNAPESPNKPQVGFFGLDLSSGKAKEENIAHDPVSA